VSREAFERAVAALIEATRPSKANIQAATAANRTLLAECDGLDQPALNLALGQLAEGLAVRGVEHPALLATACAALVERGGNPRIALDPLLTRLEAVTRESLAYVKACRHAAGLPADAPADDAVCIERHGAAVAGDTPKLGWAWRGLPYLCQAATAMLGRTRQAVARARAHPRLPALCRQLAEAREESTLAALRYLSRMLDVLHNFDSAVDTLVDPEAPGQLVLLACATVEHDAATVDAAARDQALRRMAGALRDDRLLFAALLTRACEVLVERGGERTIILDTFLDRLAETVPLAAEFVAACRAEWSASAGRAHRGEEPDDEECIVATEWAVRERLPQQGWAWAGLGSMCLSLIALLSASPVARRTARSHPTLLPRLEEIAEVSESEVLQHLRFLIMVIRVLDDEELVVLHPEQRRGYRVRIGGILNLWQLNTLLAGALVGDPAEGWLRGPRLDPRVVAAARDCPVDPEAARALASFDLFDWKGFRTDGTLEPRRALWHTALPADIPLFGQSRVILLCKPSIKHEWNAGRALERMTAHLRVEAMLSEAETLGWLDRIRRTVR